MEFDLIDGYDNNAAIENVKKLVPRIELLEVINYIYKEMKFCLFVYYSNWFANWVALQSVLDIDICEIGFKNLRNYAKGTYKAQKSRFIWGKFYCFFITIAKDYLELMEFDFEDKDD